MSLINEALKLAKQETNRREAAQKGLPMPVLDRAPRPSSWSLVAMGVLGAALVASLTALFFIYRGQARPVARPEPAPVAESVAEPVVEPVEETLPTTLPRPTAVEEQPVTGPNPVVAETPSGQDLITATPSIEPLPEIPTVVIEDPLPGEIAANVPKSTGAPVDEAGKTYLQRAELADGVTLEVSGIAWSEFDPIALVNGKAVGQGERVNGYLVVQIDPQQVEMRGEVGSIFIRLK